MKISSALAFALALLSIACHGDSQVVSPEGSGNGAVERPTRFQLSPAALANLRLTSVAAGPEVLVGSRTYPGTVRYKNSARAHVVSQVEGVVRDLRCQVGQQVQLADVICTIDSRELGMASEHYLQSLAEARFAETKFEAEARLWGKEITSRASYLAAAHDRVATQQAARSAGQQLLSLGLRSEELLRLDSISSQMFTLPTGDETATQTLENDRPSSMLACHAPLQGEVIRVYVSKGEAVAPGDELVEVADLSTVWIDARIPVSDLGLLDVGNPVHVRGAPGVASVRSELIYIAPEVEASNQTALARIELDNAGGHLRPGLFVSVDAEIQRQNVELAVPTGALVADPTDPDKVLVFVELRQGEFEATPVEVLRMDNGFAAVSGRLRVGQRVVVGETLFLKAVWLGEGGADE